MQLDDKDKAGDLDEKLSQLEEGGVDETIKPVTVEIGADGEGTVIEVESKNKDKDDGGDDDKPRLKKQGRYQRRLDQVTARASEAERTASRLQAELEASRKEADKLRKEKEEADEAAIANYEVAAKAEVDKAQKELADAIASGDSEKIAAATVAASEAGAKYGRVKEYRATHKPKPKEEPTDDDGDDGKDTTAARTTDQPKIHPVIQAWAEENDWISPRKPDGSVNENYRAHLTAYAMTVAARLEREYKKAGKDYDQAYVDAVTKAVHEKFPEEFEGDVDDDVDDDPPPQRKTPKMKSDGDTPPLRSQSNGNGAPKGGKTQVKLTPEQMQMVQFNIENDVYPRKADGSRLTLAEGYVRFAKAVEATKRKERQVG